MESMKTATFEIDNGVEAPGFIEKRGPKSDKIEISVEKNGVDLWGVQRQLKTGVPNPQKGRF